MVSDKEFLKELYQSDSAVRAKQLLQTSSDSKLKNSFDLLAFCGKWRNKKNRTLNNLKTDTLN